MHDLQVTNGTDGSAVSQYVTNKPRVGYIYKWVITKFSVCTPWGYSEHSYRPYYQVTDLKGNIYPQTWRIYKSVL